MSLIRVAIPVVLGLVALELLWGTATRRMVYRLADSVADFGCAAMSQVVGLAVTAVTVGGYALVAGTLAPLRRDVAATPFAWITVFLLVDLGQYLIHRLSHRVNVLWACHAVHHSSEEFNYAVGLRNSSFHGFLIWVFFLPLAVAGVPWRMVAVCYGINVLYQFWLHTRLIGRLGVLEAVLNTPSHHRVHHGTDSIYLDRNFGGVLIVWDRLFGTFRQEEAEPRYGTVLPLASWNPVWANVQGFTLIRNAWRRAPDWRGRLRAVVGPPEGLGTAEPSPLPAVPSPRVALYVAAHLGLAIAACLGVVLPASSPTVLRLGVGAFVLVTLGVLGGLLDGRPWAGPAERARLAALMVAGVLAATGASPGPATRQVTFASLGATMAGEITYPRGAGPFPAVALVHGSGPVTREGNAPLVTLFRDLGFVVLAYDKRGTGASGGSYRGVGVRNSDSMIPILGADAAAAARALAADPLVDARRIGLAGGSQAGWVMAAALNGAPIRFFVALSGPAVSVGEEMYFSRYFEDTDRSLDLADSVMALFAGAPGYDPLPDLRPGAAVGIYILGGLDRSVPTARSVARLRQLDGTEAVRFTTLVLPARDHSLRDAHTGAPLPFGDQLVAWLRHTGVTAAPPAASH